jgi:hypothetical protein
MPQAAGVRTRRLGAGGWAFLLGFIFLLGARPGLACGVVDLVALAQERSDIRGEQAVIIWDEAHHIEHFIRQADIQSNAPSVGFLVPTPQTPELADVDPRIFDLAADVAHPRMVPHYIRHDTFRLMAKFLWGPAILPLTTLLTGMSNGGENPVISQSDVGDYHATILKADDGAALENWLKTNGYALDAPERTWLKPYVQQKWKITAFRLNRKPRALSGVTSRAIRMSFATDRPFFPYSEPKEPKPKFGWDPRTLSVAILSNKRMSGTLAEGIPWSAQLRYAGSSATTGTLWKNDQWLQFAGLPSSSLPPYLTYYRDLSNPRPGTSDLTFTPAANQSAFRLPEIDYGDRRDRVDWSSPFSALVGLALMALLTLVPIYCGVRVLSSLHRAPVDSPTRRSGFLAWLEWGCSLAAMAVGVLEIAVYLISWAFLLRVHNDYLPGLGLPASVTWVPLEIALWLCLVLCGRRLLRGRRRQSRFVLFGEYVYSLGAIAVGLIVIFVLIVAVLTISW